MGTKQMHTPGPWSVSIDVDLWPQVMAAGGKIVANVNPESFYGGVADFIEMPADGNANRIIACVNACEGMTDEQVSHGLVSASVHSGVVAQRDELLAVLLERPYIGGAEGVAWNERVNAAIAHAPGEAAQ